MSHLMDLNEFLIKAPSRILFKTHSGMHTLTSLQAVSMYIKDTIPTAKYLIKLCQEIMLEYIGIRDRLKDSHRHLKMRHCHLTRHSMTKQNFRSDKKFENNNTHTFF